MKNFRTLLIAQLVAALFLVVILLLAFLQFGKQQLQQQEIQAQNLVEQMLSAQIISDGKALSRQLERSLALNSLQISKLDGTILYEQNSAPSQPNLMQRLLSISGKVFQAQTVRDEQQEIRVRFELNPQQQLQALQNHLWLIVFLPLLLGWLPVFFVKSSMERKYRRAAEAVNNAIEGFLNQQTPDNQAFQKLPAEFNDLAQALQRLAAHTRQQYEKMTADAQQIAEAAYKDQVTGLPNRNRFVQTYEEFNKGDNQTDFGIFAITRCTELQTLNQTRGFQEGDNYVSQVADIIRKVTATYKNAALFRLNSSDFGILLPRVTAKEAENFALQLQSRFNEYQKLAEIDSVAYTGLVSYESGKALGELLATADTSISLAQTKQPNAWHLQKESSGLENASNSYGNQNWRTVIEDVLNNNRLTLLLQTIQPSSRAAKAYSEILVRFKTHEDQILPTASFLAMAEKLDKIIAVDRMIIETALTTIKERNMQDQYFGINLSPRSVHDDQFVIWLERRLLKDANIASKLVFEVSEFGLQQNLKTSKRFIDMVHRAGARITVEKFGVGITSFKFFRDLKPDYVKMDGSYTRHIDNDKNNQYFMRLMIDLAHRIGVGVFAESVETQEEKHMLESLFIDGNQGYYIGKPTPM
jgi:EAL domain-containing protein (putative c-di-GMP-specific phosphodiesterase class I)/GGDEF domain-containing protein